MEYTRPVTPCLIYLKYVHKIKARKIQQFHKKRLSVKRDTYSILSSLILYISGGIRTYYQWSRRFVYFERP